MFDLAGLEQARGVVAEAMPPTPQYRWPGLCRRTGCDVWLKHENPHPDRRLQGARRPGASRRTQASGATARSDHHRHPRQPRPEHSVCCRPVGRARYRTGAARKQPREECRDHRLGSRTRRVRRRFRGRAPRGGAACGCRRRATGAAVPSGVGPRRCDLCLRVARRRRRSRRGCMCRSAWGRVSAA